MGLSTLNSMAFGLAVYASQGELPHHHARLASGRWSGATGRAFHPQGSDERFQSCRLHLIPLSQACLAQSHPPRELSLGTQPTSRDIIPTTTRQGLHAVVLRVSLRIGRTHRCSVDASNAAVPKLFLLRWTPAKRCIRTSSSTPQSQEAVSQFKGPKSPQPARFWGSRVPRTRRQPSVEE